jgi:catechol-2,3-dioxygenase
MVSGLAGIVFFRTTMLNEIVEFYVTDIGMRVWLEQEDCVILSHGNLLLGFCDRETPEIDGLITFFYPTKEDVDEMYDMLSHIATSEPSASEKYEIYQFFAQDPEGRVIEFQTFLRPIEPIEF